MLDNTINTIKQKLINAVPALREAQANESLRNHLFTDKANVAAAAGMPVPNSTDREAVSGFLGEEPSLNFIQKGLNKISDLNPFQKHLSPVPEGDVLGKQTLNNINEKITKPPMNLTPSPTQALAKEINPMPTPPPDKQATPYVGLINESAKQNDIPQDIFYRVLAKESMHFNPQVISGEIKSPAGAEGIGQFMPETSAGMNFDPLNPNEAIPKAAEYLAAKFKEFGNWEEALAAYNAGSGNVLDYKNGTNFAGNNPDLEKLDVAIPPFPETQRYVMSILTNE